MTDEPLDWLEEASTNDRREFSETFNQRERNEYDFHWRMHARDAQLPPEGDWRTWLIMAGRGFGKTRAGSEWVRKIAERNPQARIALVAATLSEARSVMVEGESGILACTAPENTPVLESSRQRLIFPNGALAFLYSAGEPEALRGPQHSHAWCDEIAKWPLANGRATRCWDNLLLGLRLGKDQRILATTTPRAVPLVRRLVDQEKDGTTVTTRGTTADNARHLPAQFLTAMEKEFGGSTLARQELQGELLADIDGALWNRGLIEECRENKASAKSNRVVVAVDPPASSNGDACGIIVAGIGEDGLARVLADCSVARASPEQWARAVASAAREWTADRVVAEANQGGDMVASVLSAADCAMPVKLVHATRGKVARAEPVAALYEARRVRHVGLFALLEDQLCGMMTGGKYEGPGRSPDRADALVWALTELMLSRRGNPRVTEI